MGPQLVLNVKDCMQESRLRENRFLNKGIDGCTFYGGKNSHIKRQCNQYQLLFEKKTESELFPSPKRTRVDDENSPATDGKCPRTRSNIKGSLLSSLENEDNIQTPVCLVERRGHTWKVKTSEGSSQDENVQAKCKSLSKLRTPAFRSSKRQFGRVLPKTYGSARQCLDFDAVQAEPLPKVNVPGVDFADDDDDKENFDSKARQNGGNQINIEGIIESLGDVDYSPIKQSNVSRDTQLHVLFEDAVAGKSTSPTTPVLNTEEHLTGKHDACLLDEELHQIGFPNPAGSNKCWMNATLQAVLGLEPLVRDVTCAFQQLDEHMRAVGTAKVLAAFLSLVRSHQRKKMTLVRSSLLTLSRTLGTLDKMFLSKCQQDAAEFLVRLLDCFRDEFEKAIAAETQNDLEKISLEDLVADGDKDTLQKMLNPITNNIGFTLKEVSSCTRCGESADKRQDHLVLFVDIPKMEEGRSPCLEDAVDYYMKADTRELTCGKCGNSERSVLTTVQKLPRCLVIQVKRYTIHNSKAEKLADALAIPLDFSVKKYVAVDTVLPSLLKPNFSYNSSSNEEESVIHCDVSVDIDSDCDDEDKDLQEAVRQSLLTHEEQEYALDFRIDANLNEQMQVVSLPSDHSFNAEESILSLKSECLDSSPEFSYRLVAAISHHGLSPNSGHYVADVYNHQQHKWYHYDDEVVHETSSKVVTGHNLQCNGYIFFYVYRPLFEQLSAGESNTALRVDGQCV